MTLADQAYSQSFLINFDINFLSCLVCQEVRERATAVDCRSNETCLSISMNGDYNDQERKKKKLFLKQKGKTVEKIRKFVPHCTNEGL